jgi:hypothetical protein
VSGVQVRVRFAEGHWGVACAHGDVARRPRDRHPPARRRGGHGLPKTSAEVRGKAFAWMSPHADALALRVDAEERPLMLASQPEVTTSFRTTRSARSCSSAIVPPSQEMGTSGSRTVA